VVDDSIAQAIQQRQLLPRLALREAWRRGAKTLQRSPKIRREVQALDVAGEASPLQELVEITLPRNLGEYDRSGGTTQSVGPATRK